MTAKLLTWGCPTLRPIALCLLGSLLAAAPPARAMDLVRAETRVDEAVARFGVTGRGVIVATLDRGIDWKNADFRNADGSTRIKYIFDLSDNAGANAPGNPFGRGTLYTEAQINAALNGAGPTLATRDAVGHGTDTAGIPAGNGRNVAKYRGIAPEATLIVVKVTSEGAPAHDDQPAEAPFNDPTAYPVAMDFVKAKAAELGLPCVMILNLGSSGGPTDGTSELARKIDATVGHGIPGLVFVTGPGDDGGAPNRAGGVVPAGGSASLGIRKTQSAPLIMDLFYPAGAGNLTVTLRTPSGAYGPFPAPATENDTDFHNDGARFLLYHLGANVNFYRATNGKRELYVRFDEGAGNYAVELSGTGLSADRRFDATLNPSEFFQTPAPNAFTSFNAPGSIWDGATALYNICPGDYVNRTSWTDLDGVPRSQTDQGGLGEIWRGSSTGPTFDGRLGVDVCAPGDSVFTVYNPTSYFATFRFNKIQDGLGFYGRQSAVSAAAPIVTGVVALMLQKNPTLDAPTVKRILHETARADNFTGPVPNPVWGFGKVDAFAALAALDNAPPAAGPSTVSIAVDQPVISRGAGQVATVTFTRAGDLSRKINVAYTLSGPVNGADYARSPASRSSSRAKPAAPSRSRPCPAGRTARSSSPWRPAAATPWAARPGSRSRSKTEQRHCRRANQRRTGIIFSVAPVTGRRYKG